MRCFEAKPSAHFEKVENRALHNIVVIWISCAFKRHNSIMLILMGLRVNHWTAFWTHVCMMIIASGYAEIAK